MTDMSRGGDKKDIPGPYDRTMFGAYVLFPYSDEEKYKDHDFYKSIGTVNIGCLPFLPSATNNLKERHCREASRRSLPRWTGRRGMC